MPNTNSSETETSDHDVAKVLRWAEHSEERSDQEYDDALATLADYECWNPYFRLVAEAISTADADRKRQLYANAARSKLQGSGDVKAAAELCSAAVRTLAIPYDDFRENFLSEVVEKEDWRSEASISKRLLQVFASTEDQISCLERLCVLYEKKLYNDRRLNESYQRLLDLDPYNLKALRYFKMVFTQQQDWAEVVVFLRKLLECSTHELDRFRVAQELAAALLYQLDRPQQAIEVIKTSCEGSPLDTSTIEYDAKFRLNDWPGCLAVLDRLMKGSKDPRTLAVLSYRKAVLYEKLGHLVLAKEALHSALKTSHSIIEPLEKLVSLELMDSNWTAVGELVASLKSRVGSDDLRRRCEMAEKRISLAPSSVE